MILLVAVRFAFNLQYRSHTAMLKFLQGHVFGGVPRRKSYSYKKLENSLLFKLVPDT